MRRLIIPGILITLAVVVLVARRRRPEPSWEPGEFNPDFDLTTDEILADLRGEAPTA